MELTRRAFLAAIAVAPVAALAPWRPAAFAGVDVGVGLSYSGIIHYYRGDIVAFARDMFPGLEPWQEAALRRGLQHHLARAVNPPVVLRTGRRQRPRNAF